MKNKSTVVSFIAREQDDIHEISFQFKNEELTEKLAELYYNNAVFGLSKRLSRHEELTKKIHTTKKEDYPKLKDEIDKELEIGKSKIDLVIVWEHHTFDKFKDVEEQGLYKYLKGIIK